MQVAYQQSGKKKKLKNYFIATSYISRPEQGGGLKRRIEPPYLAEPPYIEGNLEGEAGNVPIKKGD
jgi:hypothetical protein